jgi:N-acetylglucosamine kinase
MNYFIGIDGGGTKTKCVLCDDNLNIIYSTKSGPSNFLTIGTNTVSETILDLIIKSCKSNDISTNQIKCAVLGTTGAGRENDARKLESSVYELAKKNDVSISNFKVVSDARIALEGAFSGKTGSILIAGTGSIMFGKDHERNIHRVGGFGRLIGDEGSGLTLGRKGLNLIAKYYDGRGKESSLVKMIEKNFDIKNQDELITKVYGNEIQMQDIAPLVIKAAEMGDENCKSILEEETNELILHIVAMSNHLNDPEMKIVFIGGTITSDNAYSKMLIEKINLYLPKIQIQSPDYPPEIGAVIIAKQFSE